MKKMTLLLAFAAFATAAFAQTTPSTEVKTRDNGTTKVVTKTGRTDVGQALDNTKDAAGNAAYKTGSAVERGAKKTGRAVERGAKKTGRAVKRGANKVSTKAKEGTKRMEAKTE